MKKLLSKYFPAIPVALVLVSMLFSHACANTSQAPTGGDRDTIPPVVVRTVPENYSTGMPVQGLEIVITFDEYVKIKTASNIVLSPPLKKAPKSKLKGKSVVITFEEELEPDMTYTLDFIDAIEDNNEANKFTGFTYVFSTGDTVDSLMMTGIVRDCSTLQPVKGVTVLLHSDLADSAVFQHRPVATTKTDDWGFFTLRNIKDTSYRIYAVKDENNNFIYDPDELELVAFVDTLIRPKTVVNDSIPELIKYDMKDTVNCLARKAEYEMYMFKEKPSRQDIVKKVRVDERTAYLTFMAPNAHIDSMWIAGIQPDRLITQFNLQRDSLEIWVNDRRRQPDTLHMFLNYRKTDSLGVLSPALEHVKVYYETEEDKKKAVSKSSRRDLRHEDTLCVYNLTVDPATVEQVGFSLEFTYPIINEAFDSLKLKSRNPRQQESPMEFELIPDSLNIRKFRIMPKEKLLVGYDYILKVPHRSFRDINGFYNDSSEVKVTLPNDEKLSTLNLILTDVQDKYIFDFMDERMSKVLRNYVVDRDTTISFPYLKEGKYTLRITEDLNRNSYVDSGSLLEHRLPEKALFYKSKDEGNIIEIKESMEIDQEINLSELFKK